MFGLGAMGSGIATNLIDAGHLLHLTYHRKMEAVDRLVAIGARLSQTRTSAVENSDVVILCLPRSDDVNEVIDEILPALNEKHLVLDTGTSSIVETSNLSSRLQVHGVRFAEAPMAGGTKQATEGVLGAFVGADESDLSRINAVLASCCASIEYFGPVGSGGRAKLISNYLVIGMIRLILETFTAADLANVDLERLYRVIRRGSADSPALQRIVGSILEDESYTGYTFSVDNAFKDLQYIAELSIADGLDSVLNNSSLKMFELASELGLGNRMVSELLQSKISQKIFKAVDTDY